MGRSRKPMDMQSGNITNITDMQRRREEEMVTVGAEQIQKAPDWMTDKVARKEWYRLVKELKKIEIIGNLDLNNLAAYCNAYANYRKATDELEGQPLIIEEPTKYGTKKLQNPLIGIQRSYAEEMRKFASTCGLTIDSRLKAAVTKTSKKEQEVDAKFGGV